MQSRFNESCGCFDEWRNDYAIQRSDAIMLQDDKERILVASGEIEIFDNVELSRQSKHPHAVGKQAVRLDHLIVGVNGLLIFFVPLPRGSLTLRGIELWKLSPDGMAQEFRKIEACLASRCKNRGIQLNRDPFIHGCISRSGTEGCVPKS